MRVTRFFVRDGLLPKDVLGRAKPSHNVDLLGGLDPDFILAGLKTRSPKMTLKDLAASLEGMHIETPRGSHTGRPPPSPTCSRSEKSAACWNDKCRFNCVLRKKGIQYAPYLSH